MKTLQDINQKCGRFPNQLLSKPCAPRATASIKNLIEVWSELIQIEKKPKNSGMAKVEMRKWA